MSVIDIWSDIFAWSKEFDLFYSAKEHLGDSYGSYKILFTNGPEEKLYEQISRNAVKREWYVLGNKYIRFQALIFHLDMLKQINNETERTSSFNVLKNQNWILDWNCVQFKKGSFVVTPPSDGCIKFKPTSFVYPEVQESYNYLREFLNKRLKPIECTVKNLTIKINKKVSLDEAVVKFGEVAKQQAIKAQDKVHQRSTTSITYQEAKVKSEIS